MFPDSVAAFQKADVYGISSPIGFLGYLCDRRPLLMERFDKILSLCTSFCFRLNVKRRLADNCCDAIAVINTCVIKGFEFDPWAFIWNNNNRIADRAERERSYVAKVIKGLNNPSDRGCSSSTRLNGTPLCAINRISLDDSDERALEWKNG